MTHQIKAVLFDVGGPLDTETIMDREIDEQIKLSFRNNGIAISDAEYADVNLWAVDVFAAKTYHSIMWKIADGDMDLIIRVEAELMETVPQRDELRGDFELREGMPELLAKLSEEGLLLGLAANQPAHTVVKMERFGIAKYFTYKEVSGSINLRKPDPRLLLHSCQGLGVQPEEAIMVGDRIDNDIVPARMLGMAAIRFVSGRHSEQQPRSWNEAPHADVYTVEELGESIRKFIANPPNTSGDDGPE
ncbi:MAG: HAD family hydrolase [Chloroflexi bacterium]|jgi:putative hydrolase of the HAD superfamily|nr:HAD family hydrolase [Chloroflexota bacterium]MBT5627221.1 HAD family hydrolase [Chloroflexota bacterium]